MVLVHEPFVTLAKAQCQALGAKDPTLLVYKQDAPREFDEESERQSAQRSFRTGEAVESKS